MTVPTTHRHDEQHRGIVPEDQLATGTPTSGFLPTATGTGEAVWAAGTGGSSCDCCFQPASERFVALGDTPETFTLAAAPLYGVRAYVQGVRADPVDVAVAGSDVSLDTSADDVVLVDYEAACGTGVLMFPGSQETHDAFGSPQEYNVVGRVTVTAPAYLVIRATNSVDEWYVGTDDFPAVIDLIALWTSGGSTAPQPGDVYMVHLDNPGTYWIAGKATYDPALTGSGTFDVHYPSGGGSALPSPGTDYDDAAGAGSHVNLLATINTTTPVAVFVTLNAALPAGFYLGATNDTPSFFFFGPASAPPGGVDPLPAGVYVFVLDETGEADGDWHIVVTDFVAYDGGITIDGSIEQHAP